MQDYDSKDRLLMSREERALERRQSQAKRAEREAKEEIARALAADRTRQGIAKEALRQVQNRDDSGYRSVEKYLDGAFGEDELITGFEPRSWDRD